MWRQTAAALLIGGLFGCMAVDTGPETGGMKPHWGASHAPASVPGLQGQYGTKVPMAAPYSYAPPGSQYAARQMMNTSVPMNMVQFNQGGGPMPGGPGNMPGGPVPPGGVLSPPGVPFAPGAPGGGMIAPANYPSAGGSGVMWANVPPGSLPNGGIQLAQASYGAAAGVRFPAPRTQVRFGRPTGMKVYWFAVGPDGKAAYSSTPVETPGRYNFAQSAIYRLKLSNIDGRPGLELYPTMEVVPSNPKTDAFLAHNAVPVDFSAEDFKQVAEGNYIEKVIYLPDPQYQDSAGTGIDEIVSTRLEAGQSPVQEALKRGSILLVIRMGNVDQEAPNTPPLVNPGQPAAPMPPQFGPGMHGPTMPMLQVPIYGMPNSGPPHMGPSAPMMPPPGGPPTMPGAAAAPFHLQSMPQAPPTGVNPAVPGLNPLAPSNAPPALPRGGFPPLDVNPLPPPGPIAPGLSDAGKASVTSAATASTVETSRPATLPVSGPSMPSRMPAGDGKTAAPIIGPAPTLPLAPPPALPGLPN